jgi:hypothetical protein
LFRSFAAKDEIFCLFEGLLDNLGRLGQQYGLCKGAIEAYKTLRDRAPYPASFMLSQLAGGYAFVLFDKSTSSLLVASVSSSSSASSSSAANTHDCCNNAWWFA